MSYIARLFWKGLVVVLPISISIALLFWVTISLERLLGSFIKSIIGIHNYIPGFGIILTFILIILSGSLVSNYVTRRFVTFLLDQFERLPLIKSIYSPVKDLVTLFGNQDAKSKMKRVVWVEFDPHSGKRLGLVTREHFSDLGLENDTKDLIAVFIPLSFMLGGYTVLVHKSKIKETNIPVDKALKLGITGWIHLEKDKKEQKS